MAYSTLLEISCTGLYCIYFLKIDFVLANSADPDEMLYSAAFPLGIHWLQKYLFRGFQSTKDER